MPPWITSGEIGEKKTLIAVQPFASALVSNVFLLHVGIARKENLLYIQALTVITRDSKCKQPKTVYVPSFLVNICGVYLMGWALFSPLLSAQTRYPAGALTIGFWKFVVC